MRSTWVYLVALAITLIALLPGLGSSELRVFSALMAPSHQVALLDPPGGGARSELRAAAQAGAPKIDRVEARCTGNSARFWVTLQLAGRAPRFGEWGFQLFLNVDQNPFTSYSHGYEFLVNGDEEDFPSDQLPDGSLMVRRTQGGGGPGGWGDSTGTSVLQEGGHTFVVTVPLCALDDDDCNLD